MRPARSLFSGRIIISLAIFLALSAHSFCTETEDPIRNGGGARPMGIGRAVTAALDDINAAYYNPAGLMGIRSAQFTGMYYTKVYGNYHYFVAAGATPTDYGVLGLGFISSGIGQIPVTLTGTDLAYAEYTDNLVFLTYADSLKKINPQLRNVFIGSNIKVFSKGTTGGLSYTASGLNADLGIKYIPYWWLSLGMNKQNVLGGNITWSSGEEEQYPSPLFAGVAVKSPTGQNTYSFDVEFPSYIYAPTLFHMGAESKVVDNFFLRAGLDQTHDSGTDRTMWNPSFGAGIVLKGIAIDYAFHPYYDDPGYSSHFVSLSFIGEYESGIKARAGTESKKTFGQNDIVDLTVKVPFEADNVTAHSPTQQDIPLRYDPLSGTWVGTWEVPQDFRSGVYNFKATILDLEGNFDSAQTNDIFIKESPTPETVSTPEMTEKEASKLITEYLIGETLDPQKLVTRSSMAKIISKAKDYIVPPNSSEVIAMFTDMTLDTPEAGYIAACFNYKVIIGYTDNTYRPEGEVKYVDLIVMMIESETIKEKRELMLKYMEKIKQGKHATFDDMLDAFAAAHYLDNKYGLITTGEITGGKRYNIKYTPAITAQQ